MAIGVGGQGYLGVNVEVTPGTYLAPVTTVPILNETLMYAEARYLSPSIRKSTMFSDVKQSYYHVEGDVEVEVDTQTFIYLMHATRSAVVKTGVGPYTYVFTPSTGASAGPNGNTATPKTLSITIVRNSQVFKYVGCVVSSYNVRVENGILLATFSIIGLGEVSINSDTPAAAILPTSSLLGANAHTVSLATPVASPTVPTWVAATNFQTFQFSVNDNGNAEVRIQPNRQAAFVSFGQTEGKISATRDFEVRADYDNFVASTLGAFQLKSVNAASDSVQFNAYRGVYTAFPISLPSIGGIVVANAEVEMMSFGPLRSLDVTVVTPTVNIV